MSIMDAFLRVGECIYIVTMPQPHAQIWSGRTFSCLKTLAGHEGKIMCVDVAPDGSNMLASVSYDRTIKMWAPEEAPAVAQF